MRVWDPHCGCMGVPTSARYCCRASWMVAPTAAYCLQNLGVTLAWCGCCIMPSRSWYTSTCHITRSMVPHYKTGGVHSVCKQHFLAADPTQCTHSLVPGARPRLGHTCPLQWGPAPMPMVGMDSSRVNAAATTGGTHSSTTAKHPASCKSCKARSAG